MSELVRRGTARPNVWCTAIGFVGGAILAVALTLPTVVSLVLVGCLTFVGFVAGSYIDTMFRRRPRRDAQVGASEGHAPLPPVLTTDQGIAAIRASIAGRVSPDVAIRTEEVCAAVEQALPRIGELGTGEDQHILRRTISDYLPSAINPYLGLPRATAETKRLSNGKTAEHNLCDQLDVMRDQAQSILSRIRQADDDKLVANGSFLTYRFGRTGLTLPSDNDVAAENASLAAAWREVGITLVNTQPRLKRRTQ